MATIQLPASDWVWYKKGVSGYSVVVGYEDGSRRVGRYQFTAPSTGATHVDFTFYSAGRGAGNHIPIKFYIGTDPDSHANAGYGSTATGTLTLGDDWLTFTGSADILLIPNQTYYLWIFPGADTFGWYWASRANYTSALVTSGAAQSTIGATDANIGANSAIAVDKKSSAYTHSIKYEFGSLSGYITSSGGVSTSEVKFSAASVSFTVPTSFYAQIPNAKTGKCKLTCTTYSGSTKIGDAQTTEFTVTAAESSCKPTVSGTVVDSNETTKALTGDESKLIKYFSDALCTIEATAKNSATIKTKKIGGTTVSGDTRTILDVETGAIAFAATDSRGYSASVTVKFTLINYIKLTVNAQLHRVDPTSGNAILTVKGNYFNGSFGAVANTLTCRYRLAKSGESYGSWVTVTPTKSGNSYSFSVNLSGLDYQYSYSVQVHCQDKLITLSPVATVSQGIPVVDWGAKDFRFNFPFLVPAAMYGTTLPTTGKKGQVFFLDNGDGTYSIRIHDGISW